MRSSRIPFVVASLLVACGSARPTEAGSPAVMDARAFVDSVARDVTRDGPIAWQRYFDEGPSFFMAVNGRLIFADGKAAHAAIPAIARTIARIELTWGSDVKVDAVSAGLAIIAAP